jgi:immune inhibitor A
MVWRPRVQSYDATFGLQKTPQICLHVNTTFRKCYGKLSGNPLFDDTKSYWIAPDPSIGNYGWSSVPLPGWGVSVRVLSMVKPFQGYPYMTISINP